MIVKGKGNYTGSFPVSFEISPAPLAENADIAASASAMAYDAKKADDYPYQPKVTVKDAGKALNAGKDYGTEYVNTDQASVKAYLEALAHAASLTGTEREAAYADAYAKRPYAVVTAIEGGNYLPGEGVRVDLNIYETKLTGSNLYVIVSADPGQTVYTGEQVRPQVTVYYGDAAAVAAARNEKVTDAEG